MSKLIQKFKKWISGLTTIVLLASFLVPSVAFAAAPVATVNDLITSDTTPALSGLIDDATATVEVSVDGHGYSATNLGTTWELTDDSISPALGEGVYVVTATPTNIDGEGAPATGTLTVDITAPVVLGVTNGGHYNTDVAPTFTEGTAVLKYSGNIDPFVSGTVITDEGIYVLEVTDLAGNNTVVVFTVDKTAPVITLLGVSPQTVERGSGYVDAGATCLDDNDGASTINGVGAVNTAIIDTYYVYYNCNDLAGNAATEVQRTVYVSDTQAPTVDAGNDKIVNAPAFQDASASDFPFAIASHLWEQVSGPGTANIIDSGDPEDVDALISADVDGVYVLKLTVTDAGSNLVSDTMTLTWDTTDPVVDAGNDIRTNKTADLSVVASDATSGIATYLWEKFDGAGNLVFSATDATETNVTADTDGLYTVRVTVTDRAGNSATDELVLDWDTQVNPVKNLQVTAGDKTVKLTWENPADKDLKSINVYRSLKAGELGDLVVSLVVDSKSYLDSGLVNGMTYYYSVVTLDDLDNTAKTNQISATPKAPIVETIEESTTVVSGYSYFDNNIISEDNQASTDDQAVKSDETEKTDDNSDTNAGVSTVGIIILILLIALGLYLLYLQNPEMFEKLAFWKKNKKGSLTLPAKKQTTSKTKNKNKKK